MSQDASLDPSESSSPDCHLESVQGNKEDNEEDDMEDDVVETATQYGDLESCKKTLGCSRLCPIGKKHKGFCVVSGKSTASKKRELTVVDDKKLSIGDEKPSTNLRPKRAKTDHSAEPIKAVIVQDDKTIADAIGLGRQILDAIAVQQKELMKLHKQAMSMLKQIESLQKK